MPDIVPTVAGAGLAADNKGGTLVMSHPTFTDFALAVLKRCLIDDESLMVKGLLMRL